jgi:hypothetical protein
MEARVGRAGADFCSVTDRSEFAMQLPASAAPLSVRRIIMPTKASISDVADGLFNLEDRLCRVRNLAYAAQMLASSDAMPKEPGAALYAVADTILGEINDVIDERTRLWNLAGG